MQQSGGRARASPAGRLTPLAFRQGSQEVQQRFADFARAVERSEMSAGERDQRCAQQLRERSTDLFNREKLVSLSPENGCRNTTRAQLRADICGLLRVEIPGGANELQASLRALICRQHLSHGSALRQPSCEYRKESIGLSRIPGLDPGNGAHCPLTCVDTVEHGEATDTPGLTDNHELSGGGPHVVGDYGYARQSQLTQELQHPSSLAGHVDTRAGRRLGFAVTDEIRDEHAKTCLDEQRADARPQTPGRGKPVQQKKRETLPVVFQTDSGGTDLDGGGHRHSCGRLSPHRPSAAISGSSTKLASCGAW